MVCLAIQWVEETLVKDGRFALTGEKALKRTSGLIQNIVVDVRESPINCRKEGQRAHYSGKEALHAEDPVIIERNSLKIIDIPQAKGSERDFKVYKTP
jgi:hypothetical protein